MRVRGGAVPLALLLISLAGIGIAAYLTTVHYAKAPVVCATNGLVNCERVLSSSYSTVLGVPWSLGGIVWFAVTGGLAVLLLLRRPEPSWLQPAQIGWSLLGLLTVLYLVGVEAVSLGVLCAWCSAMHVLIVVVLGISLFRHPQREPAEEPLSVQPSPRSLRGRSG